MSFEEEVTCANALVTAAGAAWHAASTLPQLGSVSKGGIA